MQVNPPCTIQRICWYKPFWIQRGESYQKEYPEEWEKGDVEQSCVSPEDKSCLTAIFAETDRLHKAQEDERTTTRDAPSWKDTGTQESIVTWRSLGAQPPSKARTRHFIHPRQFGIFTKG